MLWIVGRSAWLALAAPTNGIPQYNSRLWQTDDGLPSNAIQALAQTRDGYIWVGTQKGVARFNGMQFTALEPPDAPGLKNSSVTALCECSDGSLWIGTNERGVTRLKNGAFSHFTKTNGLSDDAVRAVFSSRDGSIWIGTTNGFSRFHDGTFSTFTTQDGLLHPVVRCFGEDKTGTIWIGTGHGVNRWKDGKITAVRENILGEEFFSVRAISADAQGVLWFGVNESLARLENENLTYVAKRDGLPVPVGSSLCPDRQGNLWIGTYDELSRLTDGNLITEFNAAGESYEVVNAIMEDQEGNIWVGTKAGLSRLNPKIIFTYTKQHGLSHNNVVSVLEDRTGAMWSGTWRGGINQIRDGKMALNFSGEVTSPPGFPLNVVLALHESRDGGLWIGLDFNVGLFHWRDGKFTRYGKEEGLIDPALKVICEDRAGNLWIGSRSALVLFKDGVFTRYTTAEGLAGNTVQVILEDSRGILWIGTSDGLSRWQDGKFLNFTKRDGLSASGVTALYEDAGGTLWIGTAGGGLNRLKVQSQDTPGDRATAQSTLKFEHGTLNFSSYTTQHGLWDDEIFEILEDDAGYLWMSCLRGIFRIKKQDFDEFDLGKIKSLKCVSFGKDDGLATTQCNGVAKPAGWKSRDGRLWFATANGLAVIDPRQELKANDVVSPVVIEEVWADKKRIQEPGVRSQELRTGEKEKRRKGEKEKGRKGEEVNSPLPLFSSAPLLLSPGRGELEFHYAALSFRAPEKNRFQ